MTTSEYALSLIKDERDDQINKHGFSNDHALQNPDDYAKGEMANAAAFSLTGADRFWPRHWHSYFKEKIVNKSKMNRLIVAGALIVAEIERLYSIRHNDVKNVSKSDGVSFEEWKAQYIAAGIADGMNAEQAENQTCPYWLEDKYNEGHGALESYLDEHYTE